MKQHQPTLRSVLVAVLVGMTCGAASTDVKLPAIFGDHMVLQRDATIPVWGWADPGESPWAALAEAQMQTLSLPNTGMAVCIDIGDGGDIHPKDKGDVAARLALAARHVAYGEDIPFSGPVYRGMKIEVFVARPPPTAKETVGLVLCLGGGPGDRSQAKSTLSFFQGLVERGWVAVAPVSPDGKPLFGANAAKMPQQVLGVIALPGLLSPTTDLDALRDMPVYLRLGAKDNLHWDELDPWLSGMRPKPVPAAAPER